MKTFTTAYLDEPEIEDDGPWYALQVKEYFCKDCQKLQRFVHILIPGEFTPIIIFDRKDDDILLETAILYGEKGLSPRVIDYEPDLGLSITVYDLCNLMEVDYDRYDD